MDYDFRKYYKLPFRYDKFGWIYDMDDTPVFSFELDDDDVTDEMAINISNLIINGTGELVSGLHIEDGCDLFQGDVYLGSFRGWGNLTSPACCGLSCEDACKVQDNFIEYCMARISADNAQHQSDSVRV